MTGAVTEAEKDIARPWDWVSVTDVLRTVHHAGGILLIAHPANHSRGNFEEQKQFIESLLAAGVDGFELYHPSCMIEPHFERLVDLARSLGCVVSGGSDMHGDPTHDTKKIREEFIVPDWVVETIDAALENKEERQR
jgi:predicted metal-dependent phosphoesterase TrpH